MTVGKDSDVQRRDIQKRDDQKREAAVRAVAEVEDGMVLGLGTGSTMAFALEALAARVRSGLKVVGIPTSEQTAALARRFGIPLTGFAEHRWIDLTIDGADQVERRTLRLIKGLGGALLREKIVATASGRMSVIVDESKVVDFLGGATPLPVEIVSFGWQTVIDALVATGCQPKLRMVAGEPFVTDGGNHIADCQMPVISDPLALEARLAPIVGVIESGLFLTQATRIYVGRPDGVMILENQEPAGAV